jgi:hypothetical protein
MDRFLPLRGWGRDHIFYIYQVGYNLASRIGEGPPVEFCPAPHVERHILCAPRFPLDE